METYPGLCADFPGGRPGHRAWCPAWGAGLAPREPKQQDSREGASMCQVPGERIPNKALSWPTVAN